MKKYISMFLAMCMLFALLSVCAYADEPLDSMSKQELFQLAAQVFPEHAAEINRGLRNGVATYSMVDDEIVESETRRISENETVELAIFRSGSIVVAYGKTGYTIESSNVSTSPVGPDIVGSTSFIVGCNGLSDTITLSNIGFIIHQNGTGYFTSYGSNDANNKTTKVVISYNSSTSLSRSLIFYSGNKPIQISFTCTVGNSQVVGQLSY